MLAENFTLQGLFQHVARESRVLRSPLEECLLNPFNSVGLTRGRTASLELLHESLHGSLAPPVEDRVDCSSNPIPCLIRHACLQVKVGRGITSPRSGLRHFSREALEATCSEFSWFARLSAAALNAALFGFSAFDRWSFRDGCLAIIPPCTRQHKRKSDKLKVVEASLQT